MTVSALLLLLLAAPTADGPQPSVWAHLVPWFNLRSFDVNRRDWSLATGLQSWPHPRFPADASDQYLQVRLAAEAGFQAFAVDLIPAWSSEQWDRTMLGFFTAAEQARAAGQDFWVSPCLDNPGALGAEELARRLAALLERWAASPAWPRLDGRWVVWTYAGTSLPPDGWRALASRLEERGWPVLPVVDATGLLGDLAGPDAQPRADALDRIRPWVDLPSVPYRFRTDAAAAGWQVWMGLQPRLPADSPAVRLCPATLWPGYWSVSNGWFCDALGTGWLRRSFAQGADCPWLALTTWNDYGEHTHVEPSLAYGYARLELLRALLAHRRGDPWPGNLTGASVWVVHDCEARSGAPFAVEVFALVPGGTAPGRVSVRLAGQDGPQGDAWLADLATDSPAVQVASCDMIPRVGEGSWFRLHIRCELGGRRVEGTGPPVPVWRDAHNPLAARRQVFWRPDQAPAVAPAPTVEREDGVPDHVSAAWPQGPPASQYLLHNGRLIAFGPEGADPVGRDLGAEVGKGRPPWMVFRPVPPLRRWGFYSAAGVTSGEGRVFSLPVWVAPSPAVPRDLMARWTLDEDEGEVCRDEGLYGCDGRLSGTDPPSLLTPGRDGGGACLRFGGSGYVSLPGGRFPTNEFLIDLWAFPDAEVAGAEGHQCLVTDTAGVIFGLDRGRFFLQRTSDAGWRRAESPVPVPAARWVRLRGIYDGAALSVEVDGVACEPVPCQGLRRSNQCALGCNPFGTPGSFYRGLMDDVSLWATSKPPE